MAEEKLDEKAALKKVAKERGISKSEAYRELQRSKISAAQFAPYRFADLLAVHARMPTEKRAITFFITVPCL